MFETCFPDDEGNCFPENVRHILKFFSTMKVFVILWLFNYLKFLPRINTINYLRDINNTL